MSIRQLLSPREIIRQLRDTDRLTESITIIVIPSSGEKPLRFAVPRIAFYVIAGAAGFSLLCLATFVLWSGRVFFDAYDARWLRKDVARLSAENHRIVELEGTLRDLQASQQKILAWAGMPAPATAGAGDSPLPAPSPAAVDTLGASSPGAPESTTTATVVPRLIPVPAARRTGWRWPVNGWISHPYDSGGDLASDLDDIHPGVDIIAPRDTPVLAASDGRVTVAGWDDELGNMIVIEHSSGISTVYGHNAVLLVASGAHVAGGQAIARVGSTGRSSAPHLHFEVRSSQQAVDPEVFLAGEWRGR